MKTSLLSWSMVLVATALVACGDDTSSTTGAGGEGGTAPSTTSTGTPTSSSSGNNTTTSSTGNPTSTASTSSGEQGGGGNGQGGEPGEGGGGNGQGGDPGEGGGGNGQGGDNGCEDLEFTDVAFDAGAYIGGVDPALGGAGDDFGVIYFDPIAAEIDLATADPAANAVFAGEDFDDKVGYSAVYLAAEGTLTVAEDGWSTSGVVLREIDLDTGEVIDGGTCFNLGDLSGDLGTPLIPGEWTCDPGWYGAGDGCDCVDCGAYDPDCDDDAQTVFGCEDGQTCSADGLACEGVPEAWTCDDADYGDGTTCDCTCGTGDPDCDGVNPVVGCTDGQTCSSTGACLDPEALCDDLSDNDEDGLFDCDDPTACEGVAECVPGATAIGLGCDANTDCTGGTGGPICLNEVDLGFPGGQCAEWCDLEDDGCPAGTACFAFFDIPRGMCAPTCTDDSDCDNAEAVCTADGICVAGGVPAGWECSPAFYGTDDGCDCGCGIVDPDCADATEESCEFCSADSCGNDGTALGCDLAEITDDNNAVCE